MVKDEDRTKINDREMQGKWEMRGRGKKTEPSR